ncbi:hypothetical protein OG209_05310 [Streptomyces sp. NBC_01383]|uniref:hypothetical protein n=1 Tax=Streptomyces sp. NBC_01383 TaxID=2903846 RepID=UPI003252B5D2
MTTSPPQVNGHSRPLPVITDWQAFLGTPAEQPVVEPAPTPAVDLVAQAEADAIRTRVYAEAEERRIKAEAEAEALKTKAVEEARKQKLANDKAEARAAEEQAARNARIAESKAKQEEAGRAQARARQAEREQQEAEAASVKEVQNADASWKYFAVAFAVACAVVALPVQMSAFWHRDRPWMISAPFMLEAGAWVVLRGAAAAVAAHRPHWHFRLIAWLLAFISAGINLWHGLAAFDTATAVGTAFASLAGPGVWDLHEHGRIQKRDGALTRRQRRAERKEAQKQAAAKAAQEQREAARDEARQKAMEAIEKRLAEQREAEFPDEWKYALKLAVAMGEITVTDAVWDRAWDDLHAAPPGVTANSISARNAAATRMQRVLERDPSSTPSKVTNAQRGAHLPPAGSKPRPKPVPPRRKRGDSTPFHPAAKRLAADTARRSMTVRINDDAR